MSKILSGNTIKNFLIMQNNLLQIYYRLLQFKKTAEANDNLFGNKLTDKIINIVPSKTKKTEIPKDIEFDTEKSIEIPKDTYIQIKKNHWCY